MSASSVSSTGSKYGTSTATVYLQGNTVKAIGRSSWGDDFEASGTTDSNEQVQVGITSGKNVLATYTGVISGDSGNGIWLDKFQCYGTWTATKQKQVEPSTKLGHTDIEKKLMELKQLLDKGLINRQV